MPFIESPKDAENLDSASDTSSDETPPDTRPLFHLQLGGHEFRVHEHLIRARSSVFRNFPRTEQRVFNLSHYIMPDTFGSRRLNDTDQARVLDLYVASMYAGYHICADTRIPNLLAVAFQPLRHVPPSPRLQVSFARPGNKRGDLAEELHRGQELGLGMLALLFRLAGALRDGHLCGDIAHAVVLIGARVGQRLGSARVPHDEIELWYGKIIDGFEMFDRIGSRGMAMRLVVGFASRVDISVWTYYEHCGSRELPPRFMAAAARSIEARAPGQIST